MKKLLSMTLVVSMTAILLVSCGKGQKAEKVESPQATTTETRENVTDANEIGQPFADMVKITIMNSKPEITEALEIGAKEFGSKYNVSIEIYETASPGNTLAEKYAAGDAPTIGIMDLANIRDLASEKLLDLSNQPWVAVGGRALGAVLDDKVYGMPLTVEGMCLIYNKTAIEKTIGHEFDATKYTSLDEFSALQDELQAGGMKYPMVLNAEDWSIGQKGYQW